MRHVLDGFLVGLVGALWLVPSVVTTLPRATNAGLAFAAYGLAVYLVAGFGAWWTLRGRP